MGKYNISKEFDPLINFKPPINKFLLGIFQKIMKPPRKLFKSEKVSVETRKIAGYNRDKIKVLIISPNNIKNDAPCLVYFHGGGFVFEAAKYHYQYACEYAIGTGCKIVFVKYRLGPKYKFPYPLEDCYCAYDWTVKNSKSLNINKNKIILGGDSAGGTLAASVCLLARDRNMSVMPAGQMLIYPFLDATLSSQSNKKFTDTPMWNSKMSKKISDMCFPDKTVKGGEYVSPVTFRNLRNLPEAYIETAEFDSLKDDGLNYAKRLARAKNNVELYETVGTIHGYDMITNVPTTRKSVEKRIAFLNRIFSK